MDLENFYLLNPVQYLRHDTMKNDLVSVTMTMSYLANKQTDLTNFRLIEPLCYILDKRWGVSYCMTLDNFTLVEKLKLES